MQQVLKFADGRLSFAPASEVWLGYMDAEAWSRECQVQTEEGTQLVGACAEIDRGQGLSTS